MYFSVFICTYFCPCVAATSEYLILSFLSSGHLRSQSRLQPSANRYSRNGPVQRAAGMYLSVSLSGQLIFWLDIRQKPDDFISLPSPCSLWLSSWLRTITTPGAGRRRWSYSPKVRWVFYYTSSTDNFVSSGGWEFAVCVKNDLCFC